MDPILISAVVLLAFEAVWNAREFSIVYRSRNDKAKMMEAHSQIGEASELVAYVLAGILLYLSNFNVVIVGIVIVIGIYHVGGAITKKESFSKWSDDRVKKLSLVPMLICAIEVILSIYVITTVIPLL